jgi:hypothetical protein
MYDDVAVLSWIDQVSTEFVSFIKERQFLVGDVARSLGISDRDLRKVKIGINTNYPRIVTTEVYAKLYYHSGLSSADPRTIPGMLANQVRAWDNRQYARWKSQQTQPMFVSDITAIAMLLVEMNNCLAGLFLPENEALRDSVAASLRIPLHDLQKYARLLLLSKDRRDFELTLNSDVSIDLNTH